MSGGSGDGPAGGAGEFRLAALERAVERIDGRIEKLDEKFDAKFEAMSEAIREIGKNIVRIEAKLEYTASATEVAAIRGRVEALPTTWQMITLVFGILGGAFVILRFGLPH